MILSRNMLNYLDDGGIVAKLKLLQETIFLVPHSGFPLKQKSVAKVDKVLLAKWIFF